MPLYIIDILAVLILILGRNHIRIVYRRHRKVSLVILLFILALLPTTFSEFARIGFFEPTYMLGRNLLHIFTVWSLVGFLWDSRYLKRFLIGLALGVLFTSAIAVMNSLPQTGPWVRAHIFTIEFLKPQRENFDISAEVMMENDRGEAERGNSLLGKSNITGCVIITILPFLIGAIRNLRFGKNARLLMSLTIICAFFGLIFTYSRSTYIGIALLLFGYLIFERTSFSKRLLPAIFLAAVLIGTVGVQSSSFKFDFLVDKFDLTNETYEATNRPRILAYTRPFELLFEDPTYYFRGAGRTFRKLREHNPDASILQLHENEMHSVLAASVFYRGFIAMLLIFYLYYLLAISSYRATKRSKKLSHPYSWLVTASFISLMCLLPAWAFTHYLVSKLSGHMHLFILVAMVLTSLDYVRSWPKQDFNGLSENKSPGPIEFRQELLKHD